MSGTRVPGRVHDLARAAHVVGGLHEAERDKIDAELQAESQVRSSLAVMRRRRQRDARRVDAFLPAERPAVDDHGRQLVAVAARHRAARCGRRRAASDRPAAPIG